MLKSMKLLLNDKVSQIGKLSQLYQTLQTLEETPDVFLRFDTLRIANRTDPDKRESVFYLVPFFGIVYYNCMGKRGTTKRSAKGKKRA